MIRGLARHNLGWTLILEGRLEEAVQLLEEGKIQFRLVGTHRRVKAADLMAYKTKDDEERKAALAELSEEAEKLGLGY